MSGGPRPFTAVTAPSAQEERATGTRLIGGFFAWLRDRIARGLLRIGLGPNTITFVGLLFSAAAGVSFALRLWGFRLAALFIVAAGACDMLDGAVAKLGHRETAFGGFFDSSTDRYSDGFLFGGLVWYWSGMGNHLLTGLALSSLIGAFLVSYTRARAENLIDSCKVGLWERGERTTLLLIGAAVGRLPACLLLLGTLTHLTVLQRVLHTRARLAGREPEPLGPVTLPGGKLGRLGWWLLHRVLFWGYPRMTLAYDVAVAAIIAFALFFPFRG